MLVNQVCILTPLFIKKERLASDDKSNKIENGYLFINLYDKLSKSKTLLE